MTRKSAVSPRVLTFPALTIPPQAFAGFTEPGAMDGYYERRGEDGHAIAFLAMDGGGRMVAYRSVVPGEDPDHVAAWVINESERVRRASMGVYRPPSIDDPAVRAEVESWREGEPPRQRRRKAPKLELMR